MIRHRYLLSAMLVALAFLGAGWFGTKVVAQSVGTQGTAQVTPEQQKQLDQLKQLDAQLQADRTALHDAIAKYGWDSDQVDAAQDRLTKDRTEYRNLRRSLQRSGVAVPAPTGFGPGGGMGGPGRGMRAGRGGCCGHGHHNCPGCADCPCCGK
jgi:hypothetical protein